MKASIIFNAAYSPWLNPVEQYFRYVKATMKEYDNNTKYVTINDDNQFQRVVDQEFDISDIKVEKARDSRLMEEADKKLVEDDNLWTYLII